MVSWIREEGTDCVNVRLENRPATIMSCRTIFFSSRLEDKSSPACHDESAEMAWLGLRSCKSDTPLQYVNDVYRR